ncbi:MAG: alpha-L-arabinofuranosidase C-terminal domain-containing protein [Microthrixaceae bacterium]
MTLNPTTVTVDTGCVVADLDPRVFGGLLEHMGRCVYEGIYDLSSPHADEFGCRRDVLEALGALEMTAMRYPGGNFVSGYDWRDGIGPAERRPVKVERAWRCLESNQFGTDEFLALCERMNWTPMMAVNLGTGTAQDAQDLVAYCTASTRTKFGDLRASHGRETPYEVDLWCLGNEMDGSWQIGHTTVDEYTKRARDAAAAMREVRPGIEVVACGSSDPNLRSYPAWDRAVMGGFGDGLDLLSVHRYARNWHRRTDRYVAFGVLVDRQIEQLARVSRDVARREGYPRAPRLSFDEYNVWYRTQLSVLPRRFIPRGRLRHAPHILEEVFDLQDALVVAGFLNSFVRHADVVRVANLAQVANVIAPIITRGDDLLLQSTYDVFRMFSSRKNGEALEVDVAGPTYDLRWTGTVPFLDVSAVHGDGQLHVHAVNRSQVHSAPVQIQVAGATVAGVREAEVVTGAHPGVRNTWDQPDAVRARPLAGVTVSDATAEALLPPLSVSSISFEVGSGRGRLATTQPPRATT